MFNHAQSAASYQSVMPTGALLTRACVHTQLRAEYRTDDDEWSSAAGCLDATGLIPAGGWFAAKHSSRPVRGAALFTNRED